MPKHTVRVTQTFRVERTILVDVEGDDPTDAALRMAEGEIDVPDFKDPGWKEDWNLQNETVGAVS